jgi:hypothetical protein
MQCFWGTFFYQKMHSYGMRNDDGHSTPNANRRYNDKCESHLREANPIHRLPEKPAACEHCRQQNKSGNFKEENVEG